MPSNTRKDNKKDKERKRASRRNLSQTASTVPSSSQPSTSQPSTSQPSTSHSNSFQALALRYQHLYAAFVPEHVLSGDIVIAALDKFSDLIGLIPPSVVYGAECYTAEFFTDKSS